jgi:hypothetical protein
MLKVLKELAAIVTALIEILLILRFVLKFVGATDESSLVSGIYSLTQMLQGPFHLAFPTASVRGGIAIEFTTLFAIFAYAFMGYIVQEGLDFVIKRSQRRLDD